MPLIRRLWRRLRGAKEQHAARQGSAAYWTTYLVDNAPFQSPAESLDHFAWRAAQYPGYLELMPVSGADDKVVVDYGCGPGNDLVGFAVFSSPRRLIGVDVSPTALQIAAARLKLHGRTAELHQIREDDNTLPVESGAADLVHSSGVLHHVANLDAALREIRRILRPGGTLRVMVYNYNSVWLHLYTAYIHQIERGLYSDAPLLEAFRRTTDGPHCPISHCYRPEAFVEKVTGVGFTGRFTGASVSVTELSLLPRRFDAIGNRRLAREHRDFLSSLQFDASGHPLHNGQVAGINAHYEFTKV
jgi:SAM-dependent methyltransferase